MMNFLRKQMKWVMGIIVVAFLLSTFLMYEGRGTRRTPGRNPDGSMSDYEVAQINGRSLMRSELERRLRDYLSNYSSRSAESLDMPAIYQAVLDQAILESQLAKEVEEKGIRVSDADADRAMKDYADRYYPTRETFYQALANSGVKVDDYKRSLARQMATEQVIREAVGEIVISEDQAVNFYETMKLFYSRPEGYMLHMADFKTSDDAEYLRAKIEAGESWDVIASSDELASHDVINITRQPVFLPTTAFSAGVLNVLASVDVGKVSPVFSMSSFDYAVGLKTEHVDATVRPYDEVSADIRTMLTNQEERRRLTEYETSLRNKAQVVINDNELFARPVVSEDEAPAVEDVIPELAESADIAPVSEEPKAEVEAETPAVVSEDAQPVDETPTPAEETQPVDETPAPAEETQPVDETPTPAEDTHPVDETPTPAEETQPVDETPTPAEDTQPVDETPAPAEETQPVDETPTPAEETQPVDETPTPAEDTQPVDETPTPVEEVITHSEDMPIQEAVKDAIEEVTQDVEEILSEDKPTE